MRITLVRNATLLLELGRLRLLLDPALDDAGARPPVEGTPNPRPNPLVPLPRPAEELVRGLDAVLVTHLHRDHFDTRAEEILPRDMPLLCQPEDAERLSALGFADVRPVVGTLQLGAIEVMRTSGRHGSGERGRALGPVSGFVLRAPDEPVLYVAGDTIWCREVEDAIEAHRPEVAVVNAGGARFLEGDPIVMTTSDVAEVVRRVPTVIAVHLEAINHCLETRADVRAAVPGALVPEDGETIEL